MGFDAGLPAKEEVGEKRYPSWLRPALAVAGILGIVLAILAFEGARTAPVRQTVQTFTALIAAGNRGDLVAARSLCTSRYLKTHDLRLAEEGGLVGLPRSISRNFQVWREGPTVRLCPTNRIGPVYQFVREEDQWRFDGPVGLLMPGGKVEALEADPSLETAPE
jgi:hypothetical protein